ncbi:18571_t:CDS:2, partial [Racocetra fulgida]
MSDKYLDDMVLDDTNIGGSEFSSTESLSSNEASPQPSTSQTSKNNLAFKKIIEELDVQANVLSIDCLKELLINSKDKILKNVREYAINNTEINNSDPYIGLMLHWINDNFQIKEIIGNISYLSYPHTADCLLNKIVEILDSLNLKNITVCEDWNKLLTVIRNISTRWNSTFYLLKWLTILKPVMYKYKLLLVEANNNNLLKNYEEKELLSNDWDKVTELVKLLHPYEIVSKKLSGSQYSTLSQAWFAINFIKVKLNYMPIFTEDERSCTILEACVEFELISNSHKLDTLSDTKNQIDLTLSCDKINDEDIFALPTDTSSQEQSSYQD